MEIEKLTPQLNRIMKIAAIEAARSEQSDIGVDHLLVALVQEDANQAADMIRSFGLSVRDFRLGKFTKDAGTV
jgi:ATP-dependent Clp protease ATP-binding subunit ClpA